MKSPKQLTSTEGVKLIVVKCLKEKVCREAICLLSLKLEAFCLRILLTRLLSSASCIGETSCSSSPLVTDNRENQLGCRIFFRSSEIPLARETKFIRRWVIVRGGKCSRQFDSLLRFLWKSQHIFHARCGGVRTKRCDKCLESYYSAMENFPVPGDLNLNNFFHALTMMEWTNDQSTL